MFMEKIKKMLALVIYILFGIFLFLVYAMIFIMKPMQKFFSSSSGIATIQWTIFIISVFIGVGFLVYLLPKFIAKINKNRTKLNIFILVILTIIPRVIWIGLVNVLPKSDFLAYQNFANLVNQGKVEGNTYISLFPHYLGYSSFLSVFHKFFGSDVIVVQLLNVVICCGITVLIYLLGKRIFGNDVGIIAALFMVFWPSQIFYVVLIATESLYTFLLLLCIYIFVRILDIKRSIVFAILMFAILGIECAITNAIRPFGIIMLTAILLYYFMFYKQKLLILRSAVLSKATCTAALFIGYILFSSGITWTIESAVKKDIPKFPAGFNMYVGVNYKSKGAWNTEDANTLLKLIRKPGNSAQDAHNELMKMAIERVKQYTIKNARDLFASKFKAMWTVDNDSLVYIKSGIDTNKSSLLNFYKYERVLIKLSNYYYYVLLILCGLGVVCLLKRKEINASLVLILLILGISSAHLILEVAGRYHYSAISIFSLLASFGLINIHRAFAHLSLPLNINRRRASKYALSKIRIF